MLISGLTSETTPLSYLIQTFPETISFHDNIAVSNLSFSDIASTDYSITASGTLINYSLVDYSLTDLDTTSIVDNNFTYEENHSLSWESDVSYWYGNASYTRQLQSSTYYEIDLYLTCSVSGSTAIGYAFTSDDNGTVPSWINLSTTDRKLKLTTPELDADTNFTFSVQAIVIGDTNTYVNKYYLEVLRVNITNNT